MSITPENAPYRPAYVRDTDGLYYRVGGGGGGGAGADEVWIGPDEPIDPAIELWLDTDDNTGSGTAEAGGSPVGTITMYGGQYAPTGWHLCDGSAHGSAALQAIIGSANSPNLVNRFVVAAGGGYAVGATGGADSVALTIAQMPSHNHSTPILGKLNTNQAYPMEGHASGNTNHMNYSYASDFSGGNGTHENRPPYYALTFIIKK